MSYIFQHEQIKRRTIKSLNARGWKELFGSVIKSWYNAKTVTVKIDFYNYNRRYNILGRASSKFHVHDPYEMCRVGDRVCIKACGKISPIKHYYLRNFFYMTPRVNFSISKFLQYEKEAIAYNQNLQKKEVLKLSSFPFQVINKDLNKKNFMLNH